MRRRCSLAILRIPVRALPYLRCVHLNPPDTLLTPFQQWLDSSPESSDDLSSAGSPPMPALPAYSVDDEIIPTAIVIKNIPFNVSRETLLSIMVSISFSFLFLLLTHQPIRSLLVSPFLMPSTTTWIRQALFVVLPLQISATLQMQTPSSLPSTASTSRAGDSESSTKRSSRLVKRSASNAKRLSVGCAPCNSRRNSRPSSTSSMMTLSPHSALPAPSPSLLSQGLPQPLSRQSLSPLLPPPLKRPQMSLI